MKTDKKRIAVGRWLRRLVRWITAPAWRSVIADKDASIAQLTWQNAKLQTQARRFPK